MKKFNIFFFLLIVALTVNHQNILAEDPPEEPDCNDITCEPGWTAMQTGWVPLKVAEPEIYCVGKVCYCFNYEDQELPQFDIKKIIFLDSTCLPENYNPEILKLSVMGKLIENHSNYFPPVKCSEGQWYTVELQTAMCYKPYYEDIYKIIAPCDGVGHCVQPYHYCWDDSVSPMVIRVEKWGPSMGFGPGCENISPDPYEVCTSWCDL